MRLLVTGASGFLGTHVVEAAKGQFETFAGFFSRIRLERKDPKMGPTKLVVSAADQNQNKNPVGVVQPRTGQFLKPQPLDRAALPVEPSQDPRTVLAASLVQGVQPVPVEAKSARSDDESQHALVTQEV